MKPATSVYIIKPKYIFKTPFLKYDLQNPTNRQAQNEELTEYFNYGFNEDTMNIYVKLVNRMLKVLDYKKNLEYFNEPSQLMRLNDEIPMDLGGFCKFYDPQIFKNDFIQNDQQLLKNFLFNIVKATWINGKEYPTYPMLEFVKSMYPPKSAEKDSQPQQQNNDFEDNPLHGMIEQISKNLEKKYEQTMKKLIEQKSQPKQPYPSTGSFKKNPKFEKKPRTDATSEEKNKQKVEVGKKKDRKDRKSSSSSDSSSGSSSSSSSSSSDSGEERRRRQKDRKERDTHKETSKPSRRSRSKSKSRDHKSRRDKKDPRYDNKYDSRRDPRVNRQSSYNDERDRSRTKKRSDYRSRSRDHKSRRR